MHLFPGQGGRSPPPAPLLLGASGEAHATAGVVFVHGTGDQSVSSATTGYWTQKSIDTMRNGRPYLIVGYPGASCAGFSQCSWGPIVDQIVPWVNANGITSYTVITHSNGSSPLRYMLGHTGAVSAKGYAVNLVTSKISQVIFSAPDLTGTPLADQVTTSGSFLNIANSVVEFFGGGSYNNPAVLQQRTDNMRVYNSNGTFAGTLGATSVGGKPISVVRGNRVYANLFSSDAHCGGYLYSIGLKAAALLGWGSFSAGHGRLHRQRQLGLLRQHHHRRRPPEPPPVAPQLPQQRQPHRAEGGQRPHPRAHAADLRPRDPRGGRRPGLQQLRVRLCL